MSREIPNSANRFMRALRFYNERKFKYSGFMGQLHCLLTSLGRVPLTGTAKRTSWPEDWCQLSEMFGGRDQFTVAVETARAMAIWDQVSQDTRNEYDEVKALRMRQGELPRNGWTEQKEEVRS